MIKPIACRANIPAICRVHGVNFASTLDLKTGTFNFNPANDINKTLRDSQNYSLLLTDAEKEALASYANQSYTQIGEHLYGVQSHDVKTMMTKIDTALAKHKKIEGTKSKIVYRATKLFDNNFATPDESADFVSNKFKVGQELTIEGYMSTTTNPEALFDFLPESYEDLPPSTGTFGIKNREQYLELLNGKDSGLSNIVYEIETSSGAPLSSFGHANAHKEQEHLLPRNMRFVILEVVPNQLLNNPNKNSHEAISKKHATLVRLKAAN
jgi:hypothetical protein